LDEKCKHGMWLGGASLFKNRSALGIRIDLFDVKSKWMEACYREAGGAACIIPPRIITPLQNKEVSKTRLPS
jgi:uncharacterized protein (DUF39 family)